MVALSVGVGVLYRIHIKVKVFPDNNILQTIIGDYGSSIINVIFIISLNKVDIDLIISNIR